MDAVDNIYMDDAITALMGSIGVKETADSQTIVSLVRSRKVKEAIKEIAKHLGLPIEVNLSYVSNEYSADAKDGFRSHHLVKTDSRGRGTDAITAQVSIPSSLPFYGTTGMVNYPINVRVRDNCAEHAMTFVGLMAHELSHVVLHSIRHTEKQNEFYTDLTAMMLGFAEVMRLGRKVVTSTRKGNTTTTHTTTYGYLSDSNFDFAIERIRNVLDTARAKKHQAIKKIDTMEEDVHRKTIAVYYFRDYLAYLDKHLSKKTKKISQHDGQWIATFHQPDYTAEFVSAAHKMQDQLRQFRNFVQNLNHYNDVRSDMMRKYEETLRSVELDKKYDRIRGAVIIMRRYVSLTHRFRTFLKIKFGKRA